MEHDTNHEPVPSGRQDGRSRLRNKILLLAGTCLVLGLACEVAVRIIEPPPPDLSFLTPLPETRRLYEPLPSSTGHILGHPISINSYGIRGPEFEVMKAPGVFRIVVLGDSIVMSPGVSIDESFPAQLEQLLNSEVAGTVEVLNFGVWGYNTVQEVDLFEAKGLTLSPDLVLLSFFPNDAGATESPFDTPHLSPRAVLYRSYFARFVGPRMASLARLAGFPLRTYISELLEDFAGNSRTWTNSQASLLHLWNLSQLHGFRLVVISVPLPTQLDETYPLEPVRDELSRFCRKIGIPLWDTFPAFAGQNAPELWISLLDAHFNSIGHKILAGFLADRLWHDVCLQDELRSPI